MAIKSTEELREEFIAEVQSLAPELTDTSEGSILDILSGVMAFAVNEVTRVAVDKFRTTFFDTAHGPEITGGPDDLQTLAVDHFGPAYARPAAVEATGTVTFSRANDDAGDCVIPAETIVKTPTSATGTSQRFATEAEVTLTGTTINASVTAEIAGTDGNVQANKITVIETSLTDSSVTVANAAPMAGGTNEQDDTEYRETLRLLIKAIRGGTKESVEAAAMAVDGIEQATAIEVEMPVIEYDIATSDIKSGAEFFRIPFVQLYIADANGVASQDLIDAVTTAIFAVRAYGIAIKVLAAEAIAFNWTASITLNGTGPNYATLSADPQLIIDSMTEYIQELAIGADFDRSDAEAAILAIWGPAGTDDLTAFTTSIPSGDVQVDPTEKLVVGTMEIV